MPFCVGLPADTIGRFQGGRKDYHPEPCCSLSSRGGGKRGGREVGRDGGRRSRGRFIVSRILTVNNPRQIWVKSLQSHLRDLREETGLRQRYKSHGNPASPESPVGLRPVHTPAWSCWSMQRARTRTHTHRTMALSFNLRASVLCKHRSD